MRSLERAGRDWARAEAAVLRNRAQLRREAGRESWSPELLEHLMEEWSLALGPALDRALELEEYEWADALSRERARLVP